MAATKRLVNYSNAGFYQVLSAEVGTKHGLNVSGLVLDAALTAVNTALTDHIEAARKANNFIFSDIPFGKFSPLYQQDQDWKAEPANVKATVKE